jgi:hypothetical protein
MLIAQGLLLHVVCMHADKLYVKDFLVPGEILAGKERIHEAI